jgi:DNA-binding transcriptional MerR regulator
VKVLTPEERLRHTGQTVDEVKQAFTDAVEALAESNEVDSAFEERLTEVAERLQGLPGDLEPAVFENEQLHELHTALHELRDLLQELREKPDDRLDILNQMLIRIEVIRHIIRDAIDEHVTAISSDAGMVVKQLSDWLPGTTQREVARLVDVHPRTILRWSHQGGRPDRRLQLVAQLVAILRHSWTEHGVVAWFDRPNRDLDGRRPITLLDDAGRERDLLMAARATRSQYAT